MSDKARWWQRTVVRTEYVRASMDDFYQKTYHDHVGKIRAEIAEHVPHCVDEPGCGDYASRLFCKVCRTPWPCRFVYWAVELLGSEVAPIWNEINKRPKASISIEYDA